MTKSYFNKTDYRACLKHFLPLGNHAADEGQTV